MFRNKATYLIIITVLFVVLIALQHYSPKPIDWSETYSSDSKSPYGCYVLNDLFDTLFPGQKVIDNSESFFVSLDSKSIELQNLIVITNSFDPNKYDFGVLLKFVFKGNNLFLSSSGFGELFLDSLGVKINSSIIDTSVYRKGDEVLFLQNPELKNDAGYHFNKKMPLVSISSFNPKTCLKLGTNRKGDVNFIGIQYGLGRIYLHTQPLVFTNYHLLYGNVEYASKVLSYLPIRKCIRDNYYKPGRFVNDSPMRYILSQPPLHAAYYLLLLTLLLYMVTESKRRQRVVPVIRAPENRSLQFVKTVGNLYFNQQDNTDLLRKKVVFFKEFLREHYYLTTISSNNECVAMVSAKSGVPVDLVREILNRFDFYEKVDQVSESGLIDLNNKIELFYEQCL
jgi:hypothetical protein